MKRLRDTQRQKLYNVEKSVRASKEPPMGGLITVWAFFDRVTSDVWFKREFGTWVFEIHNGGGRKRGAGEYHGKNFLGKHTGKIYLPRWTRTRLYILHEIAHCIAFSQQNGTLVACHGREYAALFLRLVQHFLGVEDAKQLKAAFKAHKVKFRPKRVLSPETLARLRERGRALAAAGANREPSTLV